jgi:AraC family transcriptional regulator of adaptative response / DNA-3-methyladenine glycosylase II
MRFELAYRPPYDWESMLAFLRARAVAGVEHVDDAVYRRTLALRQRDVEASGWIEVTRSARRHTLAITVSATLASVVPNVLSRVRHAFDLSCDPEPVAARLGALAARHPGLRVPGSCDGFELAVRAVVGQQVSVAGARTLLGRLVAAFGTPMGEEIPSGLTHAFPAAQTLALCDVHALRAVGLTTSRARTVHALASAVARGDVALSVGSDVERTRHALEAIPGIGPWTSSYIAMRALGWPDAFLENDLVVLRALGETRPARARARSEAWRPWRAYATMHLWRNA